MDVELLRGKDSDKIGMIQCSLMNLIYVMMVYLRLQKILLIFTGVQLKK